MSTHTHRPPDTRATSQVEKVATAIGRVAQRNGAGPVSAGFTSSRNGSHDDAELHVTIEGVNVWRVPVVLHLLRNALGAHNVVTDGTFSMTGDETPTLRVQYVDKTAGMGITVDVAMTFPRLGKTAYEDMTGEDARDILTNEKESK